MINTKHLSLDSRGICRRIRWFPDNPRGRGGLQRDLDRVSSELISKALGQTGGNRSRAARLLSIPRQVLLYQMKKLGLDR